MSVSINIKNVKKVYGSNTVIPDLSLEIKNGELFTLLGPSGCGKTTLLRMIAGFNTIEGGTIAFDDEVVNHMPPNHRNIGMVFQNYAIFPHMTAAQNVAYGLKNRKIPKPEREKLVKEILESVQISNLADRKPENMSGGQQQRVALARAIVIKPQVLLMDEPLSNLDAKLRLEMRAVIREIQHSVGITTVYVTHDQEEALAISDRIAVMKDGILQQVGDPQSIYQRPDNVFVATFIGRSNIIPAVVTEKSEGMMLEVDGDHAYNLKMSGIIGGNKGEKVLLSVRPEDFEISREGLGLKAVVKEAVFLGSRTQYLMRLAGGRELEVNSESSAEAYFRPGTELVLDVKKEKINVFNEKGEINYSKGAPQNA